MKKNRKILYNKYYRPLNLIKYTLNVGEKKKLIQLSFTKLG